MARIRIAPLKERQERLEEMLKHARNLLDLMEQLVQCDPFYRIFLENTLKRLISIEEDLRQTHSAMEDYIALNINLEQETILNLGWSHQEIQSLFE